MLKDYFGVGVSKNVSEAVEAATKQLNEAKFMVFISNYEYFDEVTQKLHEKYPSTTIIGVSGYVYSKLDTVKEFVAVWAINEGIEFECNVMEDLQEYPIKHIKELEQAVDKVKPGKENTICLAFMTNNQDVVTTTLNSVLVKNKIDLIGATPLRGLQYENPLCDKISLNGVVYTNSCVYAIVKNIGGKIKVYKENIYRAIGQRMLVDKVNQETGEVIELNGKPAVQEYNRVVSEINDKNEHTIIPNSICRLVGNQEFTLVTYIEPESVVCLKKLIPNDVICVAELGDYKQINDETIQQIKADFNHVSTIFTVDCIFRNTAFNELNYTSTYLSKIQKLGKHVGMISGGETYKMQSTHQAMVCAVFE